LKALEVGCGPGTNLWFLAREGFRIAGIDGSAVAIASARERLRVEGMNEQLLQADFEVGNFALLPWNDSSFDAVIDIQAISHNTAPAIQSVIAEIRRVLKRGDGFLPECSVSGGLQCSTVSTGGIRCKLRSARPTVGVRPRSTMRFEVTGNCPQFQMGVHSIPVKSRLALTEVVQRSRFYTCNCT
jgi:SAM-dependent methyltransferase